MGFALASEAAARGADVTVVAANVALPRQQGIHYIDVETAAELEQAALRAFEYADVLLMAAAVADFRPAAPANAKISKADRARGKVERKRLDAVVVNDISRADIGFDGGDNEVTILLPDGEDRHVPLA